MERRGFFANPNTSFGTGTTCRIPSAGVHGFLFCFSTCSSHVQFLIPNTTATYPYAKHDATQAVMKIDYQVEYRMQKNGQANR